METEIQKKHFRKRLCNHTGDTRQQSVSPTLHTDVQNIHLQLFLEGAYTVVMSQMLIFTSYKAAWHGITLETVQHQDMQRPLVQLKKQWVGVKTRACFGQRAF